MRKQKIRIQADFTEEQTADLDSICEAIGSTRKDILIGAVYFLMDHIEKCEEGYKRSYVNSDDETKTIRVEHMYDRVKLKNKK